MPPELRHALDSWGPKMRQTIAATQASWASAKRVQGFRRLSASGLRVGTDCSGAEAPVWSLRQMGVPHRHLFSCDINATVRSFIQAACPPEQTLYADMLRRNPDDLPDIDIYVIGFPCTPYSSLHLKSRLMREVAAKPYFQLLKVLRSKLPAMAILENVVGLRKVLRRVLRDLKALRCYTILYFILDPTHFGEPVSRPRYYFLLLRRDAVVSRNVGDIVDFVKRCLSAARAPVTQHVRQRMLPNTHPTVQNFLRQAAAQATSKSGVPAFSSVGSMAGLTCARQRLLWQSVQQRARGADAIANVTQGAERCSARTDGICPTITPQGRFCVGLARRPVLGCEKLLLHGFPLHRMQIPTSISSTSLGLLGGNTMHLHCIGIVLLMGIALLKERLPPYRVGDSSGEMPDVAFIDTVAPADQH